MYRKAIQKLGIILNHVLQLSIIIGLIYIQSLTQSRAFVIEYIYQISLDFETYFLSSFGIIVQSVFIIVLTASAIYYLFRLIKDQEVLLKKIETGLLIAINIFGLLVMHLEFFKNLLNYRYLIIGFYLVFIIQSMNIKLLNNPKRKNEKK